MIVLVLLFYLSQEGKFLTSSVGHLTISPWPKQMAQLIKAVPGH